MAAEYERMKVPSREDLAWLSGVFCGEGSFSVRRRPGSASAIFAITQTAPVGDPPPELVRRIQSMLGVGSINRTRSSRPGHPKAHHRMPWQYCIASFVKAQAVLAMIWPWLTPEKKEQAARVFATCHAENIASGSVPMARPKRTRVKKVYA